MHAKLSPAFNLGAGFIIKYIRFGINFDYTKYNLAGSPKAVGRTEISGHGTYIRDYRYFIRQDIGFSFSSIGVSFAYVLNLSKKLKLDLGISAYKGIFHSDMTLLNRYSGEQRYPDESLPAAGTSFKSKENYVGRAFIYTGFNINIGYALNSLLTLKLSNSFNYTYDSSIYGSTYGSLPAQNIYEIDQVFWLNTGLGLTFSF